MSADGVTYLAAFGGGLISFLSPCVLPIVPGYLSLVTGLDVTEIEEGASKNLVHIARDTGLFIAGFTTVFLLLQLSATAVSRVVFRNHIVLTRVSGLILLSMGLFLIGSLVLPGEALPPQPVAIRAPGRARGRCRVRVRVDALSGADPQLGAGGRGERR
jgi:cytochrome c-type biogenesis protein